MKVRCVGHSCLEIETAGLRLVTDPWWAGPAYSNQWQPWPLPQPAGLEGRAIDYLFISQPHGAHLHPETLKKLRPGATVLLPDSFAAHMAERLRELGFSRILVMSHGRTMELANGVRATCYVNFNRGMLVVEDGRRVMLHAGDTLHAAPPMVVDYFCRLLRRRHPRLDALFLGYSSSSWFPNCVRLPGKDDRQQAREREEAHTAAFLRIVERLRPHLALAFGGHYVLLEPHLKWINEVRFSMPGPDVMFERTSRAAVGTRCHLLLPGDVIEDVRVVRGGCPRPTAVEFERACAGELREACDRAAHLPGIGEARLRELARRVDARLGGARLGGLRPFVMDLRLHDSPGAAIRIHVDRTGARATLTEEGREMLPALETRAEILEALLREEEGLDALVHGHGAVAKLEGPQQFTYVRELLRILAGRDEAWRAVASEGLRRASLQAVSELWRQRWPLALHAAVGFGSESDRRQQLASRPSAPRPASPDAPHRAAG